MKSYRIDEDTIWEDTGRISCKGNGWVCRIYREIKRGVLGYVEVDGPWINAEDLGVLFPTLILNMENIQRALSQMLPLTGPLSNDKIIKQ